MSLKIAFCNYHPFLIPQWLLSQRNVAFTKEDTNLYCLSVKYYLIVFMGKHVSFSLLIKKLFTVKIHRPT